ncbi:MAG: hypothetical protein FWF75_02700 [Propionibacteriaceae bacterium]|nr:hypothetical protein [Propionibacteriaceae bacterium]
MSDDQMSPTAPSEDELRAQFASVPMPVVVDPAGVLTMARRGRRRQRIWTGIGIAVLLAIAALVVALVVHLLSTSPGPGPQPNPLGTPSTPATAVPSSPAATTPTPTPSSPPPSSPPPSSPTPTPTPSDTVSTPWLISSTGIGPYRIGETYQSTWQYPEDMGGGPCAYRRTDDPAHGIIVMFNYPDADTTTPPAASDGSFQARTIYSGAPDVDAPPNPPRTAEGIGVGSTRAQVEAAYPDATVIGRPYVGNALLIRMDGVPILFDFDADGTDPNDPVTMVEVNAEWPADEFCS